MKPAAHNPRYAFAVSAVAFSMPAVTTSLAEGDFPPELVAMVIPFAIVGGLTGIALDRVLAARGYRRTVRVGILYGVAGSVVGAVAGLGCLALIIGSFQLFIGAGWEGAYKTVFGFIVLPAVPFLFLAIPQGVIVGLILAFFLRLRTRFSRAAQAT
jgi:hypothetical protein